MKVAERILDHIDSGAVFRWMDPAIVVVAGMFVAWVVVQFLR